MHECPDCYQACYCHGDIDDSEVETRAYSAMHCTHCLGKDEYEDDDDLDDPDFDDPDDDLLPVDVQLPEAP